VTNYPVSIDDPLTTLHCVDALAAGLRDILQAQVYNRVHRDGHGQARVFEKNTPPERILSLGFDPLRQATKNSVELTVRFWTLSVLWRHFSTLPISPWS